jgi:hypothetical protein
VTPAGGAPPARAEGGLNWLRALGLYTLLTVLLTWPLASQLHIIDPGDSAFFAWVMGWELHALRTDPARLPHANIFHPLRYTLGMDEPVLGTTLLALPFLPFTDDAVFLFNLVRLLTFILSGLTTYWLARELGCGEGPALFAGAAFAFSPIRTDQIAHLSTLGTQWLPLLLLFTVRFARSARTRHAFLAALFFVLAFLACGYHGLIGLAVLPPAVLVLLWGRPRHLPAAVLAAAAAGLALLPLYALHRAALEPQGYARGAEETVFFSASLESFLSTGPWNRMYGDLTDPFRTIGPNNLFPGLVVPGLVLLGGLGLWRRRALPDRESLALLVLALGAALLALGPEVRWMGHRLFTGPFALAREVFPVFRMIRVSSRAGVYIALPLVLLAARALRAWRPPPLAFAGVALLALAETLIAPIPTPAWAQVVDTRREPPPVYRWLADQPGEPPVVHLPMLGIDGTFKRPAYHESIYMVRSAGHWKPLVNGYAGIEPAHYQRLRALARSFPSEEFLEALRQIGTRYLILHRGGYGPNQWARIEAGLPQFRSSLREVARFAGDTVFELEAPPSASALDTLKWGQGGVSLR